MLGISQIFEESKKEDEVELSVASPVEPGEEVLALTGDEEALPTSIFKDEVSRRAHKCVRVRGCVSAGVPVYRRVNVGIDNRGDGRARHLTDGAYTIVHNFRHPLPPAIPGRLDRPGQVARVSSGDQPVLGEGGGPLIR